MIEPAPPLAETLSSLRTWEPGHTCPKLAIEVVSDGHPYKDYGYVQDKYAVLGVSELWVLDPKPLHARSTQEGGGTPRVAIQCWRLQEDGAFERVYAGSGPVHSLYLNAWLGVVGQKFVIASNADLTVLWLTVAETERAEKEAERGLRDAERVERETALAEIARLELERAQLLAELAAFRKVD